MTMPVSLSGLQPVHSRFGKATSVPIDKGVSSTSQPGMLAGTAVSVPAFISGMSRFLFAASMHRSAACSNVAGIRIGFCPGRGMPHTLPVFHDVMNSRPNLSQARPSPPSNPSAIFVGRIVGQLDAMQKSAAEIEQQEVRRPVQSQPVRSMEARQALGVDDQADLARLQDQCGKRPRPHPSGLPNR